MRYFIVCIFYTLFIHTNLKAQNYLPIFGQSNEWHLNYFESIYGTEYYNYSEDSIIQNDVWHFLDNYHFNRGMLIREDTIQGEVWGLPLFGDLKDSVFLLYDFSLNAGDSIYILNGISPLPSDAGWFDVDSTLTLVYEGVPRKTLFLTARDTQKASSKGAVWIEGIGSTFLLSTPGAKASLNTYGELSCVFKDGNPIYKSQIASLEDECEFKYLNTSIHSNFSHQTKTLLYPNPASNIFYLKSNTPIYSIKIFNIKGEHFMETSPFNQSYIQLSTETFQSGVYFIQLLFLSGDIETLRFIKQ